MAERSEVIALLIHHLKNNGKYKPNPRANVSPGKADAKKGSSMLDKSLSKYKSKSDSFDWFTSERRNGDKYEPKLRANVSPGKPDAKNGSSIFKPLSKCKYENIDIKRKAHCFIKARGGV